METERKERKSSYFEAWYWDGENAGYDDTLIESNDTYYKGEYKLCKVPIFRVICTYMVFNVLWSAIECTLAICTWGMALTCWITVIIVGGYALWGTWYDVPLAFPATYTWVYLEIRKHFKYPHFLPMLFIGYQSTLFGISVFLITLATLLTYVPFGDMFEWTCDSWFDYSGSSR